MVQVVLLEIKRYTTTSINFEKASQDPLGYFGRL